jgi:hypothetical protein
MADLVVAGDLGARRTQFLLSTMSRTAALDRLTSKLDIVFEPLAPSAVNTCPLSCIALYFNDEQLIIISDVRFQLVPYLAR